MLKAAVKQSSGGFHGRELVLVRWLLFFPTELSASYSEEEFNTPVAQDPADHIEDTPVTALKVAVNVDTEAEDGDTDLEYASEKQ